MEKEPTHWVWNTLQLMHILTLTLRHIGNCLEINFRLLCKTMTNNPSNVFLKWHFHETFDKNTIENLEHNEKNTFIGWDLCWMMSCNRIRELRGSAAGMGAKNGGALLPSYGQKHATKRTACENCTDQHWHTDGLLLVSFGSLDELLALWILEVRDKIYQQAQRRKGETLQ